MCADHGSMRAKLDTVIEEIYPVLLRLASSLARWTNEPVAIGQDALHIALARFLARVQKQPQAMEDFLAKSPRAQVVFFLAAISNNTLQIVRDEKCLVPLPAYERKEYAVSDCAAAVEREDFYMKALEILPNRQKEVIELDKEGYATGEIAAKLTIEPNNVRQQRSKAWQNIEKFLQQEANS